MGGRREGRERRREERSNSGSRCSNVTWDRTDTESPQRSMGRGRGQGLRPDTRCPPPRQPMSSCHLGPSSSSIRDLAARADCCRKPKRDGTEDGGRSTVPEGEKGTPSNSMHHGIRTAAITEAGLGHSEDTKLKNRATQRFVHTQQKNRSIRNPTHLDHPRNDARVVGRALHSMCLAARGHAIRKDSYCLRSQGS
jgi:hypothetical protein